MPEKRPFVVPLSRGVDHSYEAALGRWRKGHKYGAALVPKPRKVVAQQVRRQQEISAKFNARLREEAFKPAPGKHKFDAAILSVHKSIPAKKGIKSLNALRVLVQERTGIKNQAILDVRLSVLARAGLLPKVKTLTYHKHFVPPKPKEKSPIKVPILDKVAIIQSPYAREFKLFGSSGLIKAVADEMKKAPLLRSQRKIDEIIAVIAEIAPPKNKIHSLQIIAQMLKEK